MGLKSSLLKTLWRLLLIQMITEVIHLKIDLLLLPTVPDLNLTIKLIITTTLVI